MTCRPLFCDHAPDCPDLACEGHPIVILPRIPGVHTNEGGRAVSGGFGISLSMPLAEVPEVPDEPITTPEKAGGWTAWALYALAAVTCLCAGIAVARFVEALS